MFTYHVKQALPPDATLVMTITDDTGKQVRRMEVEKASGLKRVAWNLRADLAPAAQDTGRGGAVGGGRGGQPQGTLVAPGTYRATLGRKVGDEVTALGPSQTFRVVSIQQ